MTNIVVMLGIIVASVAHHSGVSNVCRHIVNTDVDKALGNVVKSALSNVASDPQNDADDHDRTKLSTRLLHRLFTLH